MARNGKEVPMNVRFGIVGLGSISNRFATVLNEVDGVELTAVASRDQARTDAFAQKFGAKKARQSYLDVITDDNVDIIYVGLTHNFHYGIIKLCLEHHKAVLCEKPLVTTQKDARELVALAGTNQILLMEALWTRCMPAYQKAREWVRQGRIGQVKLITANFCYKKDYDPNNRQFNPKLAGGSLFDVGVYPIDFATGILAEYPENVTGLAKISPSGVDESSVLSLSFAGGALASLTCGFNVRATGDAIVYGTQGRLVLDNCFGPQKCTLYDGSNSLVERFEEPVPDGFIYQIRHCADLFRHGRLESDLIPWQDTIACAEIFDTLRTQWGLMEETTTPAW
jgi:predicted dehydrogenase